MKSSILFEATMEGYANAYESESKQKVVKGVDYTLDTEKFGITAVTDKGKAFLQFIAQRFTPQTPS